MNTKYLNLSLLFLILAISISGCGIRDSIKQTKALFRCDFKLDKVQNTTLAKVDVQGKESIKQISLLDGAKITGSLIRGSLPLELTVLANVRNPNQETAALNRLEWIFYIDDTEITQGVIADQRIEIAPNNGIAVIPIDIAVDLREVMSKELGESIINFGFNLSDKGGNPTRIMLKIKPSIKLKKRNIRYPGYIKVKKDFTSGD